MNRKKKINQALKKKLKQKNAKLHKSNKPKYVSKAQRAAMLSHEKNSDDTVVLLTDSAQLNEV